MDNDEILVPFSFCRICKTDVPVILKEFDFDENEVIDAILCPHCFDILNMADDVELQYFDLDEVERLGYKVVEEEED